MGQRTYHITKETLAEYMRSNHMAHQSIVGESDNDFMLKTGKSGMRPLSKSKVEKWCIDNGKVEGYGMSNETRAIYEASKSRNTVEINAKKAHDATLEVENLVAYRNQSKEYRLKQAKQADYENTRDAAGGPVEGVHYRGGKSYGKGKPTNQ